VAARLLGYTGSRLLDGLREQPGVHVMQDRLVGLRAGAGSVRLRLASGGQIVARQAVLALGGWPWLPPELAGSDVLHSDEVLRADGYADLLAALPADDPRVTIIGGAHSAFAVAGLLLRAPVNWAPAAITVAHRSRIRVTYPDAATARADGRLVRPDDICPATGMVDRFGGLRADAAQLYQRVRRRQEPRVRLVRSASTDRGELPTADVVVAATGYTSAVQALWPGADWDGEGRLLDPEGAVVPHVYGLGLGTRRPRSERTGGEPAFHGAIDGAWFYQNIVAPQVLEQLI
jgi:hypothetical protein